MKYIIWVLTLILPASASARDYSSWLDECDEYRQTVENILERENVEDDYYYLMVAESRCNVGAESDKGAKGFWQLIPSTGKHYGCSDLHDLECATLAAVRYIRHLQESFKTFRDVIIAYNMGGHNYRRNGATSEALSLYKRIMEIKRHDDQRFD